MSDDIDNPQEEVNKGAPAWVVTFGDLMSLLLCFFVLLLSFSETDKAVYKDVAGSLEKAFGVQKKKKIMGRPMGMKMIARDFDQAPIPLHQLEEFIATQIQEPIQYDIEEQNEGQSKKNRDLIKISQTEGEIIVRLMGETTFASGQATIKPEMLPILDRVAKLLNLSDTQITIAGHTDNVPLGGGPFGSNLMLSAARATAVSEYFIGRASVDPKRITTAGFGAYRPVASNETAEGREQNRRVEIILKKVKPPDFEQKKKTLSERLQDRLWRRTL